MLVQELTVEVYFPETGKLRKWDDGHLDGCVLDTDVL